jgi:serine/threonine-protein kinase SRPK3
MARRVRFTNTLYLNPDIKLDNIQEALPDDGTDILTRLVDAEKKEPGAQKIVNDRVTIYTSRSMDYKEEVVYPILADLGMAVFGETEYSHTIQPIPYRAPEVILGMKWNESVDIWNFGVLVSIYLYAPDRPKLTMPGLGTPLWRTPFWQR